MHSGKAPGKSTEDWSLPAAHTGSTSLASAYCSASCSTSEPESPPRLRLTTFAPLSTAQRMPSAMSGDQQMYPKKGTSPQPLETTRSTFGPQAMPAAPTPLLPRASAMPDTCVPCPLSSSAMSSTLKWSRCAISRPARSSWSPKIPVSMTPTTADPVKAPSWSKASSQSESASGTSPSVQSTLPEPSRTAPSLWRSQRSPKRSSAGGSQSPSPAVHGKPSVRGTLSSAQTMPGALERARTTASSLPSATRSTRAPPASTREGTAPCSAAMREACAPAAKRTTTTPGW